MRIFANFVENGRIKNELVEERKLELIDFLSLSEMKNQIIKMIDSLDF
jgi:cytidylate kinase